jgi:hypothetical protein
MTIGGNGNITMTNELFVGGNTNLRNTVLYSGNESSGIGLYFSTPFYGTPFGASKSAIIAEPITNHSRHHLAFCMNRVNSNGVNVGTGDVYFRMHQDDYIELLKAFYHSQGGGFGFRTTATGAGSNQVNFNSNGYNYQSTNQNVWAISSDERIKDDITEADYELCFNNINKLKLKRYKYKKGVNEIISKDKYRLGFIAQEVQDIFPKNVSIRPMSIYDENNEVIEVIEDCLSIDTEQINSTLYGAFKHSIKLIQSQDDRIKELEAKMVDILKYLSL